MRRVIAMRTEMLTLTAVAAMAALTSISDAKIAHAGQSLEMSLSYPVGWK